MEIHERILPETFQDFKDNNTVQEILKGSEDVDISAVSSDSLIPRFSFQLVGNISEITENLILCSASCINSNILEALNISCIVNLAAELPDTPLHNSDIVYHKIEILDSGSSRIFPHFDETADLIQKVANSGGRTLVYCVAGVSRSASICIAYLMKHHQLSLLDAYNYVKIRRPRIKPNCGFFKQLIEYEKSLYDCNSVQMIFNEFVQMDIPDVYDNDYRLISNYSKKRRGQNGRH